MRVQNECFGCNLRQAQEAAHIAGADSACIWKISREVCRIYADADPHWTPAYMTTLAHRVAQNMTGKRDIFLELKRQYNQMALELYPRLKKFVGTGGEALERAIRVAIAGNIIDLGVYSEIGIDEIVRQVEEEHEWEIFDFMDFRQEIERSRKIVYVGDNAGEVVFDRVFLEEITDGREIVFLVKSGPISNDALLDDAREAGVDVFAEVRTTGQAEIGFIPEYAPSQVHGFWREADLIISKGQGNFETLSSRIENIYFLLKAKCIPVARELGVTQGALVLKKGVLSHPGSGK